MKKFNINEFIWFIILTLLWLTIFIIYKSSLIYNYVGTRSEKLIMVALIVLGAICIVQLIKSFSFPTRENVKIGNFIFILALILILSSKGQFISSFIEIKGITLIENNEEGHNRGAEESLAGLDKIEINDNLHEFLHVFNEEQGLEGKKIEIEGLVYKPQELNDSFIVARQEINCCAADAENLGIICRGKFDVKQDNWVKVEGTLISDEINFRGQKGKVPIIKVNKITMIKK